MTRRAFITLLGGAAAWPLAARAQHSEKLPAIGFLGSTTPSAESQRTAAFVQRLRELGWIEGRTIALEYRWGEGRPERFAEIAAEFVRLKVDVMIAGGTPTALAAKRATTMVPSVLAAACASLISSTTTGLLIFAKIANRRRLGTTSRRSPIRLLTVSRSSGSTSR